MAENNLGNVSQQFEEEYGGSKIAKEMAKAMERAKTASADKKFISAFLGNFLGGTGINKGGVDTGVGKVIQTNVPMTAGYAPDEMLDRAKLQADIDTRNRVHAAEQAGPTNQITTNTLGTGLVKQDIEPVMGRDYYAKLGNAEMAALEKAQNKTTGIGRTMQVPLLTDPEIEIAAKGLMDNPLGWSNYPQKQRSQITNYMVKQDMNPIMKEQGLKFAATREKASKSTAILGVLEEAFNTTNPSEEQLATWANWFGKVTGKVTKFDTNIAAYSGLVNASLGNLAKSLFGETGVLTDQDIARVRAALPNATTTNKKLAKMQFDYLRQLNDAIAAGAIDAWTFKSKDELINSVVANLNMIEAVGGGKTQEKPTTTTNTNTNKEKSNTNSNDPLGIR